jgi:selenocysteine lyase/cysteine desulfurase
MLPEAERAEIRRLFPACRREAYLDTATASPTPAFVRAAAMRFYRHKAQGFAPGRWAPERDRAIARTADYLGAGADEVVLLGNSTEALNLVAASLPWRADDEVVVNDIDFESNLYPWMRLRERGVGVRVARSEDGRLPMAAIEAQLTPRTRLVAVSHVFAQSGVRTDIAALGAMLHRRGILLSVDGTQAAGYIRPDLREVDFYAASIFKGLLGPFGLAFLRVRREVAGSLTPAVVGYGSVATPGAPGDETFDWVQGPQRLQFSHLNYPALYGLGASLAYLEGIGWERVTEHVLDLSGQAVAALGALSGVRVATPAAAAERLGIVSFDPPGGDADAVVAALGRRGVRTASRDGRVRVSFHVYNGPEDIERLVGALARIG